MSRNNGNKKKKKKAEKDPQLKSAEETGDIIAQRYLGAKAVYDARSKLAIGRDYKDELIEAQENYLMAMAITLDQYQKRYGDIEVLQEKPYIEGKDDEK